MLLLRFIIVKNQKILKEKLPKRTFISAANLNKKPLKKLKKNMSLRKKITKDIIKGLKYLKENRALFIDEVLILKSEFKKALLENPNLLEQFELYLLLNASHPRKLILRKGKICEKEEKKMYEANTIEEYIKIMK